jgi:RNA polymerase sigma-70 factor (ECF subfamily)
MSSTRTPSQHIQPDDGPTDHALLLGLGRGDPAAGRAFVNRHQRRVYGLARSVIGDPTHAEEIAQEAFIRAWRSAGSYDARVGSVSSWLLTITRNVVIDVLRTNGAQSTDPNAALFLEPSVQCVEPPVQCVEPGDSAIVANDTDRVRAALRLLPDEQRRALLLAVFYGRSAREISETESIPLGTAKSRIRSSLRKVRSLLSEDESSESAEIEPEAIPSVSTLAIAPTTKETV